jgi:S-(hydroxymethyl)glutathione dehydrogenase/alcohol dehydrogenase
VSAHQRETRRLVTTTYKFEEVNEGYADVRAGKNLRGVTYYTDADY